ncbi:glycosyltransferase family 4 protein [Jeotgalibacillus salarius]|uniref:Glycosyltransferase WbuB n=1 Tax=Jeotgalibacillus salarius TaxID=546023 RepID=A0A4Y8LFU3_9BACL|nr:glycosyltransferase family 4 protein [Jeotgalibacillus salarius]TFE01698.1 glycosyltransferase WbuB [Jeotgalibacillus salarius]
MNILFLTLAYPEEENQTNLYTDLMTEFVRHGHTVRVICQREAKSGGQTGWTAHRGVKVLRIRTGNITQSSFIEKGISLIRLKQQFINGYRSYLQQESFDLLIYSTPPVDFADVVAFIKQKNRCKTYLLLKDIFPQNAVDMELMRNGSLLHRYFRNKERKLYRNSDHIGCMSEGNRQFLLKHNPELSAQKVDVNPNSIQPGDVKTLVEKDTLKEKMGIPIDATVYLYGGNLGKPQGIDFLLETVKSLKGRSDIYFLIVGSGTEYEKISYCIQDYQLSNVKLLTALPKTDFDALVSAADVGMIYLDRRFTIPNIPSRLLSYMEQSTCIYAITDRHTDLKEIISSADCGFWSEAGDLAAFKGVIEKIQSHNSLSRLGENGRAYLENHFTVSISYDRIIGAIGMDEQQGLFSVSV